MAKLRHGAPWLISICTLVVCVSGGAGSECYTKHHPNGTVTYYINETQESETRLHFSWRINDVVHANDEESNSATVQSWGPHYITLKSFHENVTYMNAYSGKPISCPCRPTGYLQATTQPGYLQATTQPGYLQATTLLNKKDMGVGGVLEIIISCVGIAAICVIVYKYRQEVRTWFQNRSNSWCRRDYIQARQDPHVGISQTALE